MKSNKPRISLRAADVMKMLITSSRTVASNTSIGDSKSWDAIIIIACTQGTTDQWSIAMLKHKYFVFIFSLRYTWRHKIKKLHILSKLLKICQNERISTKFAFPSHFRSRSSCTSSGMAWNHHKNNYWSVRSKRWLGSLKQRKWMTWIPNFYHPSNFQFFPLMTNMILCEYFRGTASNKYHVPLQILICQ